MPQLPIAWSSALASHRARMEARACSPRTIHGRHRSLLRIARWLLSLGHPSPASVTTRDLEAYGASLAAPNASLATGTRRNHLTAVRLFFRELHATGEIPSDPGAGLRLPAASRPLPSAILAPSEIEAIRRAALRGRWHRLRNRALVEVLYATGMRRAECAALTIGDIDTQRQVVFVRRGKGGRQRVVPIAPRALQWVAAYLRRERRLEGRELGVDEPLFARRGRAALTPAYLSDLVRLLFARAGLDRRGACHLFRHSMATHMLDNGADIRFIQAMLGHADLSTTMVYTRVSIRGLAEVYRRTHPSCT